MESCFLNIAGSRDVVFIAARKRLGERPGCPLIAEGRPPYLPPFDKCWSPAGSSFASQNRERLSCVQRHPWIATIRV